MKVLNSVMADNDENVQEILFQLKLLSNNIMISESLHDELGTFRSDTNERIVEIKDTLKELSEMNPRDLAEMHLQYRAKSQPAQLTDESVNTLQQVAGGKEGYDTMIEWAQQNLQENEIKMYDAVMDKGDPVSCFFAVQALKYRFDDASGVDGEMLTGKAPVNKGDTFRSQAEVVRAMNDPKYENDPAYRQDVYNKLERSNLEF